jgi:hypothetical protein
MALRAILWAYVVILMLSLWLEHPPAIAIGP